MEDNSGLSPETRKLIDSEVQRIVMEQVDRATKLLTQHRPALEMLTEELLRCETVDGRAVAAAVAGEKRECTK
jgi:ATP-dependent Zn protease